MPLQINFESAKANAGLSYHKSPTMIAHHETQGHDNQHKCVNNAALDRRLMAGCSHCKLPPLRRQPAVCDPEPSNMFKQCMLQRQERDLAKDAQQPVSPTGLWAHAIRLRRTAATAANPQASWVEWPKMALRKTQALHALTQTWPIWSNRLLSLECNSRKPDTRLHK